MQQRKTSTVVLGVSLVTASLLVVNGPAGAQTTTQPVSTTNTLSAASTEQTDTEPTSTSTSTSTGAHPVEPTVTSLAIKPGIRAASTSRAGADTATVTAPVGSRDFQTVGVTWRRGTGGTAAQGITVRVKAHGSEGWSAWQDLDLDEATLVDPSPKNTTQRDGTSSLYVGPSDGAEAEVSSRNGVLPQDLQFVLIDAGTSAHDADTGTDTSTGAGTIATRATQAGPAQPKIYSRAEWGADEKMVGDAPTYMSTIKAAVLHHTAGPNGYSKAAVPSIIRGDYAYHVKSRGWDDIGYNALVDRFGRIWEGRGGGLDKNVMGAHAGGFNTDTFGVAAIGSYQYAHPNDTMTTSIGKLFAWKLALNHRNPQGTAKLTSSGGGTARYRAGTSVTLPAIMGHRNTGYTECPGGNLYAKLGTIRQKAFDATAAGLINPVGAPASVTLGDPSTITATALRAQSWTFDVEGPCGAGTVRKITGKAAAGAKITATWDGRLANGDLAPAGRYYLTLTSSSSTGTAVPVTDDVLVVPPVLPNETAAAPLGGAGGYVSLTPARIYDTRDTGMPAVGPGSRAQITVLGKGGVPTSGVTAVVLNLTAQCVSNTTSLDVWPTGGTHTGLPITTAVQGTTRSVLVTTKVGSNGQVSVGNLTGVTQLTADVVGYYSAAGGPLRAIPSTRVYDTGTSALMTGETRTVTLPATLDGVPSGDVRALLVDVGGVAAGKTGTLTAHSVSVPPKLPGTTFEGATIADNLTVVPVTGGQFALTATGGPIRAILDARGVVLAPGSTAGTALTAVTPRRVLAPTVITKGSPARVVVTGAEVPATAKAVLVQLGGEAPTVGTTLQAYPWGGAHPGGTALRVPRNLTRGNLVLVPVGADGAVALSTSAVDVRSTVDVYGYLS